MQGSKNAFRRPIVVGRKALMSASSCSAPHDRPASRGRLPLRAPTTAPRHSGLKRATALLAFTGAASLLLGGCWDDSTGAPGNAAFSVGGSVSGLTTAGLVLANGNDSATLAAGATSFTFPTALASGANYAVTVQTQPANANCAVSGGSGTVAGAAVAVSVTCRTVAYPVGGSITGLATSGLVLSNGSDSVSPVSGASIFTFPTRLASGTSYAVTVSAQPAGAICSVGNASGVLRAAPVTDVAVTCAPSAFQIGGIVAGLTSAGLKLANGADVLAVPSGALSFAFPSFVASGGTYSVSVVSQPSGLNCSLASGAGTVSTAAISNVQITCNPLAFTVGGSISGLTGAGLVLANGSDKVRSVAGATSFVFPTSVALGGTYSVSVETQPAGQTCTVAGTFPATIGSANVGNLAVSCSATSTYTLVAGQETCPGQPIIDGTGAAAILNPQITGAALDSAGNYYSFDGGRVRKVTPAGVVTTIAGGPPGNGTLVDGTGAAAVFGGSVLTTLQGLVVDGSGTIFVGDLNAIRKVSPGGVVTTIAGAAASGGVDGMGTTARFFNPTGLAFDSGGNVLVLDGGNSAIRRIDATGAVTTLTKTGSGFIAGSIGTGNQLYVPSQSSAVVDAAGTMYVGGHDYSIVYAISASGVLSAFAGSQTTGFADGVGAAAKFSGPVDFSFDAAGNLYVTDNLGTAMRKITPAAVVTTPVIASNFSNIGPGAPAPGGALVLAPSIVLSRALATPSGNLYITVGCSLQKTGP